MIRPKYRHLPLPDPESRAYKSSPTGASETSRRPIDPEVHGQKILSELNRAWEKAGDSEVAYHVSRSGVYLEFRGEALVTKSLESMRDKDVARHIRLLNIRNDVPSLPNQPQQMVATVYIPKNKRAHFFDRLEAFLGDNRTKNEERQFAPLIESIETVRAALDIECFWQDAKGLIPRDEAAWCEMWISSDREEVQERFKQLLLDRRIRFKDRILTFPERSVLIVHANAAQLAEIIAVSDDVAELRRAKETAGFWLDQSNADQAAWAQTLLDRLGVEPDANTSICILDSGVNRGHPLIAPVLAVEDCQAVIPGWGVQDDQNHGTRMAGICAYGNLEALLQGEERILLRHVLESVKILPDKGETEPDLWGYMTAQGIAKAITQNPDRLRIVCMAVTSEDMRDQGRPTSWSAEIDQLSSGVDDLGQKLFLISAGNLSSPQDWRNYPTANLTSAVHDPAQAWNSLSVGAFTDLDQIVEEGLKGYQPIAATGNLSPFSSTSVVWEQKNWPIKPEILMEGGNAALSPDGSLATTCDDLSVLSTHYKPEESIFWPFHETSCATAKASWFAAQLQSMYPSYWPETIRGLMVHSASWTQAMRDTFLAGKRKSDLSHLLHICGYGIPDLAAAKFSAENSTTLIAQAEIQPFAFKTKTVDGREIMTSETKTNQMHLHELPWPVEILQDLPPETPIHMRVTLSYFIEPGPGEIGWKDRYRYASHAFRFSVNSPGENLEIFEKRINAAARKEGEKGPGTQSDMDFWTFGEARDLGSIHSDIWNGSAQELAASRWLAVYPVIGWWRERKHLGRVESRTRYSLIVSISTPKESIKLYTPIATSLELPIHAEILTTS